MRLEPWLGLTHGCSVRISAGTAIPLVAAPVTVRHTSQHPSRHGLCDSLGLGTGTVHCPGGATVGAAVRQIAAVSMLVRLLCGSVVRARVRHDARVPTLARLSVHVTATVLTRHDFRPEL